MVVYNEYKKIAPARAGATQGTRERSAIQSWIDHCKLAQTTLTTAQIGTLLEYMLDEVVSEGTIQEGTKYPRTTRTGCEAVHKAITAHGHWSG